MRSRAPVLTLALGSLLGCKQPTADLQLSDPGGAEPSGLAGPSVIVEAPALAGSGPILDWTAVDDRFAELIEGERYRVDYDADHPWAGASSPLVTIVVFSDYQCPFCARLDESLAQLLMQYPDSLRVVWRQFPLASHRAGQLAARYALAAQQQGGFAPMHEHMFATKDEFTATGFEREASRLGLDPIRLRADAEGEWVARRVAADKDFGAELGVDAVPVFFVNGRPLRGALPIDQIEATLQDELALAERLLAAGSERREIWARILAASEPGPVARDQPAASP